MMNRTSTPQQVSKGGKGQKGGKTPAYKNSKACKSPRRTQGR